MTHLITRHGVTSVPIRPDEIAADPRFRSNPAGLYRLVVRALDHRPDRDAEAARVWYQAQLITGGAS